MKKYKYIYLIRGMAIAAVVVCHQQWILHESEWLQMFTLYSVTTLILLAGLTQGMWFENYKIPAETSILTVMTKKLRPIFCAYLVGTMAYLMLDGLWTGQELGILWEHLIGFSAAGPFYFLRYYIALTLVSPILYALAKGCSGQKKRILWYGGVILLLFILGYGSIGKLDLLGQSYLSVYTLGLVLGIENVVIRDNKTRLFLVGADLPILLFGVWSLYRYYFRSIEGITEPFGIDRLVPALDMNPPNLSIIVYSLSLFVLMLVIFQWIEFSGNEKIAKWMTPLELMGKYSMDIFIWHIWIQKLLNRNFYFPSIWIKRVIFYGFMFGLPIIGRYIYKIIKKEIKMLVN